jgi:hypothetical protein
MRYGNKELETSFFFLFSFFLPNLLEFYYTFSQNLVIKNPKPKLFFWQFIYLKKKLAPQKNKTKTHRELYKGINYLFLFFALSTCLEQNHYIYNHETPIE